jgi:hypothetical protein
MKPSAINHLHKDPLFLVKEESGVDLSDDFLILIVPKLHIPLCSHIVYMHKLMLDHMRGLRV